MSPAKPSDLPIPGADRPGGLLRDRPAGVFVLLALVFGSLFAAVTPPFQAPDENRHFYRAYQLSQGRLLGRRQGNVAGDRLPVSIYQAGESTEYLRYRYDQKYSLAQLKELAGRPLEPERRQFVPFVSVVYCPVPYLAAVLGVLPGRLLDLNPLVLMYLGRLMNLLTWAALVYGAIRLSPMGKWLWAMLALTPMSLAQAASLSADALTNGLAFLTIAFFLRCALDDTPRLSRRDYLLMMMLTVALSLCKNIYFLLGGLFLWIPAKRIGSTGRYLLLLLALMAVNLAAVGLWSYAVRDLLAVVRDPASAQRQIEFLTSHGVEFAGMVLHSLAREGRYLLHTYVGQFGWLDAPLPRLHVWLWLAVLAAAAIGQAGRRAPLGWRQTIVALVLFAATLVLIFTLMFIYWEPVGARGIRGVQGRYLIPLGPLLFLPLVSRGGRGGHGGRHWRLDGAIWIPAAAVSLSVSLYVLLRRFYL
ncbi:MAG: DUF2142 domain-containing protein [Sedimentisphaerales bacterium]|nr:DUF2142 domain-containing protein [Sedimentisphaerales bacterium]